MKTNFNVSGMTCSACSARVEKCVRELSGVHEVSVNLLLNSMTVTHDTDIKDIIAAVTKAGYGASVRGEKRAPEPEVKDNSLGRLIASIILLVILMYFSMGGMLGLHPSFLQGAQNAPVLALTQLLLTLPVLYLNRGYFTRGYKNLFKGAPNMDSLVAIGSSAAVIYGIFALYAMLVGLSSGDHELVHRYHMDLYFESGAMIVTLVSVGKYLEGRSKARTGDAIKRLMEMSPDTATVIREGKELELPVSEVKINDTVMVRPGARVPVDGVLLQSGTFDESALTGESLPVDKEEGDSVLSGSVCSGSVTLRATKVGSDTTLARIVELVREANSGKAPIARLADKVAGIFVPTVLGISAITFIIWMIALGDLGHALSCAICVLVISCPCALGLATPTAIMVGTGKAAQMGVLFRSAEAIQTLHEVKHVLLDKTGTVTQGKPSVVRVDTAIEIDRFLTLAASAENKSEHPLARSIVQYALSRGVTLLEATDFVATAGRGISATVEGRRIICGNLLYMQENDIHPDILPEKGATPLYFASEGKLLGCITLSDRIKPDSAEAVRRLHRMGITTVLLTGDNSDAASAIAEQAGIDNCIAELLPQDKQRIIAEYAKKGKVAMVGDGINDAPALAGADVGIAIGAGTDIAIDSADVVLMKNRLSDVANAIELSSAVIKNIKQNLFWAFFYNSVGIPVAAGALYPSLGILLSPMIGAAAMSLSSLFVVTNALRLRMFKSSDHGAQEVQELDGENKNIIENIIDKGDSKMKTVVYIEGMMCTHCSGRVEKALKEKGWEAVVELENKRAVIQGDKDEGEIRAVIDAAGYEVVGIEKA